MDDDDLPSTAVEVHEFLHAMLELLKPKERKRFWAKLEEYPDNPILKWIGFCKDLAKILNISVDALMDVGNIGSQALAKLKKHHKKRNEERDDEIMKLDAEGKTGGQIRQAIVPRFGPTTDGTIRAAISRRKNPRHKK